MLPLLFAGLSLASLAFAQAGSYAQCGGIGKCRTASKAMKRSFAYFVQAGQFLVAIDPLAFGV